MGQYKKAVLTAAGENLIARALAGEIQLNITKVKTSDYAYPGSTDLKSLTDMQGIRQTVHDPETTVLNDTMIQTRALFSNEETASTYYIHNIGLYALDGTEVVLFCIVTAEMPDEMPQYNGVASTSYIYNIQNVVQDAAELNISVNPSGTATIQDVLERVDATGGDISETVIETLETVEDKYPIPAVGESVKRFFGKVLTFLRNIRPLTSDIALYVSANMGSDVTGDGSELKPYASVTKALSVIPKDLNTKTATVQIANGIYVEDVVVAGFHSGALIIHSSTPNAINLDCVIRNLNIHSCNGNIEIRGISIQEDISQNAIDLAFVNQCAFAYMSIVKSNLEKVGISAWASKIRVYNSIISNHIFAIHAQQNSHIYSENNGGVNNSTSMRNATGSIISSVGSQPLGATSVDLGSIVVSSFGARIGTLSSAITLYVATTGSDTTGDGTSGKPFKTIQHAIDMLPKDLGSFENTITVANGTYDETLNVMGFSNGILNIYSTTINTLADTCKVKNVVMHYNSCYVRINGFTLTETTTSNSIDVWRCSYVVIFCCQSTVNAPTKTGIYVGESGGQVSGCRFANKNSALRVVNSFFSSKSWDSGSTGNSIGLISTSGSIISKAGQQPIGDTAEVGYVGSMFINENGTQISGVISSGLSCTWGDIRAGGYVRNGNRAGAAMVTIDININPTSTLSAGQLYTIGGFPAPVNQFGVAVYCHANYFFQIQIDGDGTIVLQPLNNINVGGTFTLGATYLTTS